MSEMSGTLERGIGAPPAADAPEGNLWENVDAATAHFREQVSALHERYQAVGGRAEIEEQRAIDRDALKTLRELYRLSEWYLPEKHSAAQQGGNQAELQKMYADLIAEIPTIDDVVEILQEEAAEAKARRLENPTDPEGELRIRVARAFIKGGLRPYLRMRPEFDYEADAKPEVKEARDNKLREALAKLDAVFEELTELERV